MAIYTRTGDGGMTSVRGGDRVSKGGWQMGVLGSLDEVNSELGMAAAVVRSFELVYEQQEETVVREELGLIRERINEIQGELLEMGALIADAQRQMEGNSDGERSRSVDVDERLVRQKSESFGSWDVRVERLEKWIDEAEEGLPELHNFILPGGSVGGAALMVARSVVRRGERDMVRWVGSLSRKPVGRGRGDTREFFEYWKPLLSYVNRLSDWAFVVGRRVNWLMAAEEMVWKGEKSNREIQ